MKRSLNKSVSYCNKNTHKKLYWTVYIVKFVPIVKLRGVQQILEALEVNKILIL